MHQARADMDLSLHARLTGLLSQDQCVVTGDVVRRHEDLHRGEAAQIGVDRAHQGMVDWQFARMETPGNDWPLG